jgi:Flp pilus assembly protein TadG
MSAGTSATSDRMTRPSSLRRDEGGASAIELVLYMPILMFTILFAVQFCLIYLGAQVASGAAREGARSARVTGSGAAGQGAAQRIVDQLGKGVLDDTVIASSVKDHQARVTVSGKASQLLPFLPITGVSETVEGPLEEFVQDRDRTP